MREAKSVVLKVCGRAVWRICAAFMLPVLLFLSGCTELDLEGVSPSAGKRAVMLVRISGQEPSRAAADDYAVSEAVALVYNSNRVFEAAAVISGSGGGATLEVWEGRKYVYVVANPCKDLKTWLMAGPKETDLVGKVSLAGDFDSGALPAQGLLMTGSAETSVASGKTSEVTVKLGIVPARVNFYFAKATSGVANMTVKSIKVSNLSPEGYLFKNALSGEKAAVSVGITNASVTGSGEPGTLVGTAYTYPAGSGVTLTVKLRHQNALADDTYTIKLDQNESGSPVAFKRGCRYDVTITFAVDETGSFTVKWVTKNNNFVFG